MKQENLLVLIKITFGFLWVFLILALLKNLCLLLGVAQLD